MRLAFYGAAGEVTGSNFVLESEKYHLMVDCGLFQGARLSEKQNYQPLPYEPKSIDALLLTHAHLDHCGRIPLLWKEGFRGKIYCTPATRDLAELIMTDAAEVMLSEIEEELESGERAEPLYMVSDVAGAMPLFHPIEYDTKTEILPGVEVEFVDAGHILGSASVVLTVDHKTVVFSGDIGNHPVPILRPPVTPPLADAVVMETTYGNRLHENSRDRRVKLRRVIIESVKRKGPLLIPAFALERTQELLYELNELVDEGELPPIPVFLDSPLAIAATAVYGNYERYFDDAAVNMIKHGDDLFSFPLLKVSETAAQSKQIKTVEGPKVIIAGSGMMEGGRIIHHAAEWLGNRTATLLFVGFQAPGTLGRALFEGRRRVKVKGHWLDVKAHLVAITAYSAHADQLGLQDWLSRFQRQPAKVFLVHGEQSSADDFARLIADRYTVAVPKMNEKVEL